MFGYVELNNYGHYTLFNFDGSKSIYYQIDYDFPALASMFGFIPCEDCNLTDGTIDCKHKTASQMIRDAQDFLDAEPSGEIDGYIFD